MTKIIIIDTEDAESQDLVDQLEDLGASVFGKDQMVDLDPRQKAAARELLMGVDLPAEMMAVAHNMLLAAFIDPKATMGNMGADNRQQALVRAKGLIDEMLGEIK